MTNVNCVLWLCLGYVWTMWPFAISRSRKDVGVPAVLQVQTPTTPSPVVPRSSSRGMLIISNQQQGPSNAIYPNSSSPIPMSIGRSSRAGSYQRYSYDSDPSHHSCSRSQGSSSPRFLHESPVESRGMKPFELGYDHVEDVYKRQLIHSESLSSTPQTHNKSSSSNDNSSSASAL